MTRGLNPVHGLLLNEAQRTIEVQHQQLQSLERKATTLVQSNLILVGASGVAGFLFAGAGSQSAAWPVVVGGMVAAVGAFLASAVLAIIAGGMVSIGVHVPTGLLPAAIDLLADGDTLLVERLDAYIEASERNCSVHARTLVWLKRATWPLVIGIVLLLGTTFRVWWMSLSG